ncbi:MAG: hypothetical protein ACP5N9_05465 [Candidatus Bilamarchaeum sp.]|jgi:hypothetical protein
MISKINNFVSSFVGGLMGSSPKKSVKKVPSVGKVKCTHKNKKNCKCN